VFATGGGGTGNPVIDGQFTTTAASVAARVSAQIGGVDAPVTYAGDAPGLVSGALQINIQVPATAPTGTSALVINVGSITTSEFRIAVK
jgi:uncharacterized protein (TIGR03437 family)